MFRAIYLLVLITLIFLSTKTTPYKDALLITSQIVGWLYLAGGMFYSFANYSWLKAPVWDNVFTFYAYRRTQKFRVLENIIRGLILLSAVMCKYYVNTVWLASSLAILTFISAVIDVKLKERIDFYIKLQQQEKQNAK